MKIAMVLQTTGEASGNARTGSAEIKGLILRISCVDYSCTCGEITPDGVRSIIRDIRPSRHNTLIMVQHHKLMLARRNKLIIARRERLTERS